MNFAQGKLISKIVKKFWHITRNRYFVLLFTASFFYLFRLGSYGFVEWDEPFYSSRALTLVQYGDLVDQSDKAIEGLWTGSHPPLVIWMQAISIKIFGLTEFAFRFPTALMGIVLVIVFYKLVFLLFGEQIAIYSSLILVLNSYVTQYSRMAQLDIPVLTFMLLSFYFVLKALKGNFFNYLISGFFLGLSLLSKLIVGFFVPLTFWFFILYYYFYKKTFDKQLLVGFTIHIFSGVSLALPWFVLVTLKLGNTYWEQAIVYHVIGRIQTSLEGHTSH